MRVDLRLSKSVASAVDKVRGEMSVQAYINQLLKQTLSLSSDSTTDCKHERSKESSNTCKYPE